MFKIFSLFSFIIVCHAAFIHSAPQLTGTPPPFLDYIYSEETRSYYRCYGTPVNFNSAVEKCRNDGAELGVPRTKLEFDVHLANFGTRIYSVWLALTDAKNEGQFKTLSGLPVEKIYTNWEPGEPNDGGNLANEDCAEMLYDGRYNDVKCDDVHAYICVKPLIKSINENEVPVAPEATPSPEYQVEIPLSEKKKSPPKSTVEKDKPSEEYAVEEEKPSKEYAVEEEKPSKEYAVEEEKPSKEYAVEEEKPSKEYAIEEEKPSKEYAVEEEKPSKEYAVEEEKPSKEYAVEEEKPSKEYAVEEEKPSKEYAVENVNPSVENKRPLIQNVKPQKNSSNDDIIFSQTSQLNKFRKDYKYVPESGYYYKVHKQANFSTATSICKSEGAQLAIPKTKAEAIVLTKQFSDNNIVYWVGIHDILSEGDFQTLDGEAISDNIYINWKPQFPNYSRDDRDCVIIDNMVFYYDAGCEVNYPFICTRHESTIVNNFVCDTYDKDYFYNIDGDRCYKLHTTANTWSNALKVCRAELAALAVINSASEAKVLTDALSRYKGGGLFNKTFVHVDFSDIFIPQVFMTSAYKTLAEVGYEEWADDEPNNKDGNEHCGGMLANGKLADVNCNTKALFFCEKVLATQLNIEILQRGSEIKG